MSSPPRVRPPAGRQGPGPIPAAGVQALDLLVARRAGGLLPGERPAAGAGTGTELAQLRPYVPGDDVRQLDPAATARTGEPHVRLQVPERLLTSWLVLDVSPSMAFGTTERLKSDVAAGVVSVLARLGTRRGGRVALLTANSPSPRALPPRGGRGALGHIRRVVEEGVAEDAAAPAATLSDVLRRVAGTANHAGLVVVVSDFRDRVPTWARDVRILAARHAVLAVEIRDPREGELPAAGRLSLVDPESGRQVDVDTSDTRLREAFAARERAGRAEVAAALRRARADHVVLATDGPWLKDLGRRLAR